MNNYLQNSQLEGNTTKWTYQKCLCGSPACNQYLISNQMTAGFSLEHARLIAAAPDLLAELELMVDTFDGYEGMQLIRAKAAIAKAKGE